MNEDQIIPVPDPVAPVAPDESVVPQAPIVAQDGEVSVVPTHQNFAPPPGLEIMKPEPIADHAGLEQFGVQQTPPPAASVDGSSVVIGFPDGFSSEAQINEALRQNAKTGERNAATVFGRQRDRLEEIAS